MPTISHKSFSFFTGKTPKKTLKGGLVVEDIRVGSGPEVKPGKMVGMYYEGRLKSNNKQVITPKLSLNNQVNQYLIII